MAMKYTCDTCKNPVWINGSHSMGIVRRTIKCKRCGGKMIMPGDVK
jgi:DNA-directed RNA polymerase subunit RPC12/RpoP